MSVVQVQIQTLLVPEASSPNSSVVTREVAEEGKDATIPLAVGLPGKIHGLGS